MTLIKRLRSFFFRDSSSPAPVTLPIVPMPSVLNKLLTRQAEIETGLSSTSLAFSKPDPLPDWLTDDESLRDEGVLFGLSNARPDGKLAQIRAAFAQQTALIDEFIEQHTEKISELNLFIEQRENHLVSLRDQLTDLRTSQPTPTALLRTVVSLCLSVGMCIGNFSLIDVALQPSFPNRWIAVGVFLTGMFSLFGRLSFFYETDTRLSGRRIIEEVGVPLATSFFVVVQALQNQSVSSAIGLFVFTFFSFLLSGKLVLSTLTALQNDLTILKTNSQLKLSKAKNLPVWESELNRLEQEVDAIRMQKWPVVSALNHAEAELNQLNAHRDRLVNVFLSEFELARSLRERLTQQQREALFK